MRKTKLSGIIILLLTAAIWGASFVAQQVGSKSVEAFTYTGIRTCLGAIILLPVTLLINRKLYTDKTSIRAGIILGIVFSIAQNLQQFAFYYSTAGKIAFITAFYIFFVTLISALRGAGIRLLTWTSVILAILGLFLICVDPKDITVLNPGDILALLGALFFAFQIMLIDHYTAKDVNAIQLSFMEFAVAAVISIILMLIFEHPVISDIKTAAPALLYSGIMSCGVAYTLQIIGQKRASPVAASLIMSLESVFAVIAAALLLHQKMSLTETIGSVLMFVAIILSQAAEAFTPRSLQE